MPVRRWMLLHRWVWGSALLAVLARFPGLMWPLRPDEAGFLLVARTWDPTADSVYGPHFVDRPPLLLAVVRAVDAVGGPYALRVVGAVACGAAVLLVAALVHELARHLPRPARPRPLRLVTTGSAILTAAFLTTPQIDAVATKSEVLGVPLLLTSALLTLRAVRLRAPGAAALSAAGAGLVALLAIGLKQSLVGGVVFAAVFWTTSLITRRITGATFVRLALAASLGALVPVLATVAWALAAGVDLSTLWYAVVSFRGDASAVLAAEPNPAAENRVLTLLLISVTTGMALVVVWCVARSAQTVRMLPVAGLAALTTLVVDLLVVGMSGSFWTPYLFTPITSLMILWACVRVSDLPDPGPRRRMLLTGRRWRRPRLEVVLVALCALSTVASLTGWVVDWRTGPPPRQHLVGQAVGAASTPGDRLVVYGGRADIQFSSGLASPYTHLWSLPMRTLDPELVELEALLRDPDRAPTWFVTAVGLDAWRGQGLDLTDALEEYYRPLTTLCGTYEVHHLTSSPTPEVPQVDCDTPWGQR